MASRKEQKEQARREREQAETAERKAANRRRWISLAAALGFAAILVVALIAISAGGGDDEPDVAAATVIEQFDGIPQKGNMLGDPDAPLTLVEFADPQCPFCADYANDVLPALISDYVERGDLRLELNLLTFVGPDSERLAAAAYAAAGKNEMWPFIDLAYSRQGTENTGYVDDAFLTSLAEAVPDLDSDTVLNATSDEDVIEQISDAQQAAAEADVTSTPSFLLGPTGGKLEPFDVSSLDPEEFSAEIDRQLQG